MKNIFSGKTVIVMLFGGLALASTGAGQVTTIYQDDFPGYSGTPLNGTTPKTTTNGAKWTATPEWSTDGSMRYTPAETSEIESAALPFTPVSGNIYTLSANMFLYTNHVGGFCLSFGTIPSFLVGNDCVIRQDNNYQSSVTIYTGSGSGWVDQGNGEFTGGETAKVVLNTENPVWNAADYYNGVLLSTQNLTPGDMTSITSVGVSEQWFASSTQTLAVVGDFTLTRTSAVPEPGTIWSAALGLLGLVGFHVRRRRKA